MALTDKPSLIKPKIGGDPDIWGGKLNENIDKQDLFNQKIIEDSASQNQELSRLEEEKLSRDELDTFVSEKVDNYIEVYGKAQIDEHIETVSKPDIKNYVDSKKVEISQYVENTSKPEINSHVEKKKIELNEYNAVKKSELDEHTTLKENQLDSHTKVKETQLDAYEKEKEKELDAFNVIKKSELTAHANSEIENITSHTNVKKSEINDFTEAEKVELNQHEKAKEAELDTHTGKKKEELDSYTVVKKSEIDSHVDNKKLELDVYEKVKEGELDTHNAKKKEELDAYEKVKEGELDTHTNKKKEEITSHTELEKTNITTHTNEKKDEISSYTDSKKLELDIHEKEKEKQLDAFNVIKKEQLDTHTNAKKIEINKHVETKKTEINEFVEGEKVELNSHEQEKEKEITSFTESKKVEITTHTDKEIERIVAQGIDNKVDKIVYEQDKIEIKNSIDKKISKDEFAQEKQVLEQNISSKVSKDGDTMSGALILPVLQIGADGAGEIRNKNNNNIIKTFGDTFDDIITGNVYGKYIIESKYNPLIKLGESENLYEIYHKGNKPTKIDVGLSNVDNTSDSTKNVFSATKFTVGRLINGVLFDGTSDITIKAQPVEHNHNNLYYTKTETNNLLTVKADKSYVDTKVADLVGSAPEALDTLKELSNALGNDPNFATTVTNQIGTKAPMTTQIIAGNGLTGGGDLSTNRTINIVSTTNGIVVGNDGITLNTYDGVDSTSSTIAGSAYAVKKAYDKGESALQNAIVAQESANSRVSKSGDTMTGELILPTLSALSYLNLKDYYTHTIQASMWVNKDNPSYNPNSLYIDNIDNLFLNRSNKVYHTGNKPTPNDIGAISSSGGTCYNLGYLSKVKVIPKVQSQDISNGTNAYTHIKIRFDSGWNNSMTSFDLKVRSYNNATDATISISCYPYSGGDGQWHGIRAFVNGYKANEWKVYHGKSPEGLPLLVVYNPTGCDYVNCGMFNILESVSNTYTITGHEGALPEGLTQMACHYGYNSYNKPSSTDVGLGNVNNWGASSAIGANSTTEYATTNMVAQVRAEKLNNRSRDNWNDGSVIGSVVGQLAWKNYGNGHTIFDASQGISPTGASVDKNNPSVAWSSSYPTLMGWNGSNTYGVRVDIARKAESLIGFDPNGIVRDGGSYGTVTFSNWVRASGNSGIYFASYGGGWHMTDATWIRSYNNKPIHVSGADITCTNNIIAYYSDVRLKKNFKPVNDALKTIMSVNPYYYEQNDFAKELGYNEEGKIQIGFKAQEMEKILPQVVQEAPVNHRNDLSEETRAKIGDEPIKTIDYARITPLLWKAVQELTDKVTSLELELQLLKANGGK